MKDETLKKFTAMIDDVVVQYMTKYDEANKIVENGFVEAFKFANNHEIDNNIIRQVLDQYTAILHSEVKVSDERSMTSTIKRQLEILGKV
jgi:hypothetical protein